MLRDILNVLIANFGRDAVLQELNVEPAPTYTPAPWPTYPYDSVLSRIAPFTPEQEEAFINLHGGLGSWELGALTALAPPALVVAAKRQAVLDVLNYDPPRLRKSRGGGVNFEGGAVLSRLRQAGILTSELQERLKSDTSIAVLDAR